MTPPATMPGSRTEFQVLTATGTLAFTSPNRDQAMSWAKERLDRYGTLDVREVTYSVASRRVRKLTYEARPSYNITAGAMA